MIIKMNLKDSYDIVVKPGAAGDIHRYADIKGRALVVTDSGVPAQHVRLLMEQLSGAPLFVAPQGEQAKSFEVYKALCEKLLDGEFHRDDIVVALGGGVVGDLAGFAAATYMRGIGFINIPTTALAQIDSSIGGKTAINLGNTKNIVGAFHQPVCVIVDSALLATLPARQLNNGLVEALKAGLIYDKDLYEIFRTEDIHAHLDEIIRRSLLVKKDVVEQDEKEQNLRKILNFGHTIGHGIEVACGVLHGEAVACGMLPMIADPDLRSEVRRIINDKLHISTDIQFDKSTVFKAITKDKKAGSGGITVVKVQTAGKAVLQRVSLDECKGYLDQMGM